MANPQNQAVSNEHGGIPWKHVVGYILSIVLTALALWVTFKTGFSKQTILIIIFIFAFLQAALQLLMFMHMTESSEKSSSLTGKTQTGNILFAAFIAIVIVAGTVWVMWAGHAKHDHHKMEMDHGKTEMDGHKMDKDMEGMDH
ncbi:MULTISPECIES: cytochrome aa3 quinol oxidase subunit IV [unclassified Fictibacillus]|uniref:cytochrome aa3 quinol oxidase subunit IV n=1 Tax=unclassified Fictibacillus TaxID=2644029 RepID=UPI0008E255C1|nr:MULTISPECIES: cytochrome aa3 quinol oxidase subunit IV [unclassified Fictibacillus]MED2972286.1 cytochrome aa3 quinol oxidase subunit IV [Fictibacillus sp. B-59209]SFE96281.1 cytochrome aa3 quinol oxidase subunit 4 [Bacillus sp. OV194]